MASDMASDPVRVREATDDDLVATMNVLDGADLAVDAARVRERIAAGDVLVAVADDRVLGAVVLDPDGPPWESNGVTDSRATHVVAVAVRRRRRGQGVGTALVETARTLVESSADRTSPLTAAFAPDVRPFYESLGFAVTGERPDGRLTGTLEGDDAVDS